MSGEGTPARPDEAGLIARYFAPLAGPGSAGLRDDAAALVPTPGHDLVLTADAVVEGVHYFPDDPPDSIAAKALAVNCSDLAAKGAVPRGFLLTLALPGDWSPAWLAAFAEGLGAASRAFACPLLGGDTVRAAGGGSAAITALGEVPAGMMIPRLGGRPGDRLCVTGTIGDAALGLLLRRSPDGPLACALDAADAATLVERYRRPRPRLGLGPVLRRYARAAMDVSDGLAGDLAKMMDGLSARIAVAQVPLSIAATRTLAYDPGLIETVLTGGDDYEVLCAVPPERVEAFLAEVRATGQAVAEIGCVEAGPGAPAFVAADGSTRRFDAGASYSHF